jgi:hypothetical protein
MRYSEINEVNQTLTNIWIESGFNDAYSYGQEWSDVPFPSIKKVGIETCSTFTKGQNRIESSYTSFVTVPAFQNIIDCADLTSEWEIYIRPIPENATWTDIFRNLDQLVGDSGDTHHRFPESVRVEGETLFVDLGS